MKIKGSSPKKLENKLRDYNWAVIIAPLCHSCGSRNPEIWKRETI